MTISPYLNRGWCVRDKLGRLSSITLSSGFYPNTYHSECMPYWNVVPIRFFMRSNSNLMVTYPSTEQQHLLDGISFQIDNVTFAHHTATVNGIQLHYVMGGKGDPVVLLHGYPQSWYEWRHVMPTISQKLYCGCA